MPPFLDDMHIQSQTPAASPAGIVSAHRVVDRVAEHRSIDSLPLVAMRLEAKNLTGDEEAVNDTQIDLLLCDVVMDALARQIV